MPHTVILMFTVEFISREALDIQFIGYLPFFVGHKLIWNRQIPPPDFHFFKSPI